MKGNIYVDESHMYLYNLIFLTVDKEFSLYKVLWLTLLTLLVIIFGGATGRKLETTNYSQILGYYLKSYKMYLMIQKLILTL